jgi:16S rRNA (guanine966-N2)-methyltransferase
MRITGGSLRSRALRAPRGQATRPTSDRVRDALCGILGSAGVLEGARVLDLYAGTGALALEALSRGADRAVLVESSRDALAAIRANVAALGLDGRAQVLPCEVGRALDRLSALGPFDLVLADPPWALVDSGDAPGALAAAAAASIVAAEGLVVLEHAARTPAPSIAGLRSEQSRRYGDTALTFYKPAILAQPRAERAEPTSE